MPVFFLVGGYVNARSWPSHRARDETWTVWVRDRALRRLWPTAVFVAAGVLAASAALLAGVPGAEVGEAGWLVALQLWFLPVIGYANYLFVWGSAPQWGFAWQDGTLTRRRWRPYAMTAGGAAVIIIAAACYPSALLPQPAVGSAQWRELRPAWFALLTVVLAALTMLVMRAERLLLKLPAAVGPPGPWSPAILLAGLAAAMLGLTRLAIAGIAPGGHLPLLALAAFTTGLLATFSTGHPATAGDQTRPASRLFRPRPGPGQLPQENS